MDIIYYCALLNSVAERLRRSRVGAVKGVLAAIGGREGETLGSKLGRVAVESSSRECLQRLECV
jgi:hypothetical protein